MALYDARCGACDTQFEYRCPIAMRADVPPCPLCGALAARTITQAPHGFVKGKFDAFMSPVDGSVISTDKDLLEHNKRNSVVQIQEGFSEEKVISGDFADKKEEKDIKDISCDIQEAIHDVTHGYTPVIEKQDEDD